MKILMQWKSKLGVSSFLARGLCFIMFLLIEGDCLVWEGGSGNHRDYG